MVHPTQPHHTPKLPKHANKNVRVWIVAMCHTDFLQQEEQGSNVPRGLDLHAPKAERRAGVCVLWANMANTRQLSCAVFVVGIFACTWLSSTSQKELYCFLNTIQQGHMC